MFRSTLKQYNKKIDRELFSFFDSKISSVDSTFLKQNYAMLKEFVLRPGKRIRPIASLMAFKGISSTNEKDFLKVCIASELFHSSSLIHDDIMDEDRTRRGKATMHVLFENYFQKHFEKKEYTGNLFQSNETLFGTSIAIMQGNLLYSLAFDCLLESNLSESTKIASLALFNDGYKATNEGQMLDVSFPHKKTVSEKSYYDMITGKTVQPLSAAIVFGAFVARGTEDQFVAMERFAYHMGLAFQIYDDVLDLMKSKGREIGSDIKKGTKTIVIVHALKNCSATQRKKLLLALGNNAISSKEIVSVVSLLRDLGSLDYAQNLAFDHIEVSKQYLKKASLRKKEHLFFEELADFVISRKN